MIENMTKKRDKNLDKTKRVENVVEDHSLSCSNKAVCDFSTYPIGPGQ
jgi:hypothetical protein